MENYSNNDKEFLLSFARKTLESYLRDKNVIELPKVDDKLTQKSGLFVTLMKKKELRGCIGNIEPVYPLIEAVRANAIAAAAEDPRFIEVEEGELKDLTIEISILTEPREVAFEEIKTGIDGVILKQGVSQATYLPQVWEHFNNNGEEFFSTLSQKAGLDPDAYKNKATKFYTYQAIVFSEKKL
jgi:uncharacterized protein